MRTRNRYRLALAIAAVFAAAAPGRAQLLGQGGLGGITDPLRQTVDDALETVDRTVEQLGDELDDELDDTVGTVLDEIDRVAAAATEIFVGAEDPAGRAIEGDVWVVLVPEEFSDRIPGWGFTIRERRDLEGLDLVLLRIDAPTDRGMTETEFELNADAPGTVVDFNHVYGPTQGGVTGTVAGRAAASDSAPATVPPGALTLGLIDTAIATGHSAFAPGTIVQQDFVPYQGERPREHGTAVASIALATLQEHAANRPLALLAASVFFADERDRIATTGSLVAALEWLGSQDVTVINMSLTGPANRVLEAALAASVRRGTVVVAAVGNEGPVGKPLYPAAYDSVIGITAIDDALRVYRRANRGPQVAFSAPGVRVRAAQPDGSMRRETGTSMAAPVAAAIIASELAPDAIERDAVIRRLERNALDLGDPGIDEVYGHGLITPAR